MKIKSKITSSYLILMFFQLAFPVNAGSAYIYDTSSGYTVEGTIYWNTNTVSFNSLTWTVCTSTTVRNYGFYGVGSANYEGGIISYQRLAADVLDTLINRDVYVVIGSGCYEFYFSYGSFSSSDLKYSANNDVYLTFYIKSGIRFYYDQVFLTSITASYGLDSGLSYQY